LRISRLLKFSRIVHLVISLRVLLISIWSTLQSLCWAMVFLLFIIYTYSLYIVQAVTDYLADQEIYGSHDELDGEMRTLVRHWGSISRSMFSLFACIANGLTWNEAALSLQLARHDLIFVFLSFIIFSLFAVLNVMTGVFCQSAIENAQNTEDFRIAHLMRHQQDLVAQVCRLFNEIDTNGSGEVTWQDLKESWSNEQVQSLFAILGLEPSDLWLLFNLIDSDKSGAVDPQEMVAGCLRLKGAAKAFDVAAIRYEHKLLRKQVTEFAESTRKQLNAMLKRSRSVELHDHSASSAEFVTVDM